MAFIDADDEWLPEKLDRQISLLRGNESLGMVCSHCVISAVRKRKEMGYVGR